MKAGDKVILSESGKDRYMDAPFNPHNLYGVIVHEFGPSALYRYEAEWENGFINHYRKGELELIQC